ncbi:MAG: hypothetical protein ACFCVA_01835 [Gammaproteobacteria bacterium]
MMPRLTGLTFALALTATINAAALAEVVLLRQAMEETPANSVSGLQRPTPGMSMPAVTARFGQPLEHRQPVGNPPITRWVYDRYTVYFEHDRVLNTVVRRPLAPSIETPPSD